MWNLKCNLKKNKVIVLKKREKTEVESRGVE
jgi:hypothetical protein